MAEILTKLVSQIRPAGGHSDTGSGGARDRIVYLNDALSGLHGSKLKNIAQDIYRSRKAIYDGQKKKWAESQHRAYLESKVPEFMQAKYAALYGLYDGEHVSEEGIKIPDFAVEQKKGSNSMQTGILALRLLNKRLAATGPVEKRTFWEETCLGKRKLE